MTTTKIHATCDALGNPVGFYLTPGAVHDLEGAEKRLHAYKNGKLDTISFEEMFK